MMNSAKTEAANGPGNPEESKKKDGPKTSPLAARNIRSISELEQRALATRSAAERVGDSIARMAGRLWFLIAHVAWFTLWVLINLGVLPVIRKFDPYPFQFLNFIVGLEAIFLALFILMSQNRATRQADQRAHLDLQINLLSELESTKTLELLRALCKHHGLPQGDDPDVRQLTQPTRPEKLAEELQERLPQG